MTVSVGFFTGLMEKARGREARMRAAARFMKAVVGDEGEKGQERVRVLADALGTGTSNVYKKLRGESDFWLSELVQLDDDQFDLVMRYLGALRGYVVRRGAETAPRDREVALARFHELMHDAGATIATVSASVADHNVTREEATKGRVALAKLGDSVEVIDAILADVEANGARDVR